MKKNKNIEICFFIPKIYSLYNKKSKIKYGGAEVQIYEILKILEQNRQFNVNIITGNDINNKKEIITKNNLRIFSYLPLRKSIFNIVRRIIYALTSMLKIMPDIVIIRGAGGNGILNLIPALFCKFFKKKFIFSVASDGDVDPSKDQGLFGIVYNFILKLTDIIIIQKYEQRLRLEKWKKRKFQNIIEIKNGFPISNDDKFLKKNILWVGTTRPLKQPNLFISLSKKFPEEHFVMICRNTSKKEYWTDIIQEVQNISNISLIEFVPYNKIDNYFKSAKIFINTSTFEGFPNTFLQAFKNKTPVISLNVNPDGIFTKNKIGFYCGNNSNKMEKKIRLLLENNKLYEAYSSNCFYYIKNKHDIDIISKKWINLFEKVCRVS